MSAATVFEGYTYPSLESTEPVAGTSYLRKARDGEVIERFVRTNEYKDNERYFLDPVCYRDYANQLIPKAAAYASLVPYYFFRAALNVSLVHQPGSLLYYNVLRVANCSSEPMMNGQLDVYNDLYTYGTNQQLVGTYTIGYLPPAGRDGFFRCMGPPYVEIILPIAGWGTTSAVFRGTLGLEEEDAVVGSNYEFCCPA